MKYQEDTTKWDRVFNLYFGIHSKQYYMGFTKCTEQCFCLIFSTTGKKNVQIWRAILLPVNYQELWVILNCNKRYYRKKILPDMAWKGEYWQSGEAKLSNLMIVNIGLLLGILWIKNTSDSLDVILFIFIRHNSLWRELVCEKRCKDASTRYYFYERNCDFTFWYRTKQHWPVWYCTQFNTTSRLKVTKPGWALTASVI